VSGLPAIRYLGAASDLRNRAARHDLLAYATEKVSAIRGGTVIGPAQNKAGVLSFTRENGWHASHDIGTIRDHEGISVRTDTTVRIT